MKENQPNLKKKEEHQPQTRSSEQIAESIRTKRARGEKLNEEEIRFWEEQLRDQQDDKIH